MSFRDLLFPEEISEGALGGPGFNTALVELDSGAVHAVQKWAGAGKRQYQVGYGIKEQDDLAKLLDFFIAVGGSANTFRFKDFADHTTGENHVGTPALNDEQIGVGDGVQTQFQLVKRYTALGTTGAYTAIRSLTKPVEGTVTLGRDGVVIPGSEYTVDYVTGVVTFNAAPASPEVITAGCEFHVHARFGKALDDLFQMRLDRPYDGSRLGYGAVPNIPIDEELENIGLFEDRVPGGSKFWPNGPLGVGLARPTPLEGVFHVFQNNVATGATNKVQLLADEATLPAGELFFFLNTGTEALDVEAGNPAVTIATIPPSGGWTRIFVYRDDSGAAFWAAVS